MPPDGPASEPFSQARPELEAPGPPDAATGTSAGALRSLADRALARLSKIGADPRDDEDARLRKAPPGRMSSPH